MLKVAGLSHLVVRRIEEDRTGSVKMMAFSAVVSLINFSKASVSVLRSTYALGMTRAGT